MAWFHCGIGLGVWWEAGNCGRMDSLVGWALVGWVLERRGRMWMDGWMDDGAMGHL